MNTAGKPTAGRASQVSSAAIQAVRVASIGR
jgi:hypothetical protein